VSPLDVFTCPLEGVRLIEASAGTGKTWNICGLYLRLLLEQGQDVQELLVVTFTTAATAELRDRIRQRIVDTRAFLRGAAAPAGDPFVPDLVRTLREGVDPAGLDDATMLQRLDRALHGFDEASIFTIHGFCQRALSDAPFSAQVPLSLELVPDDSLLLQEIVHDFWRRRIAGDRIDPALAAHMARKKDTPQTLTRLLKRQLAKPLAHVQWPAALDAGTEAGATALQAAHERARQLWLADRDGIVKTVLDALGHLNANSYKDTSVQDAAAEWDAVLASPNAHHALAGKVERWALLGAQCLADKTRKGKATPRHPFFDAAQALIDQREAATSDVSLQRLRLIRELLEEGPCTLRDAKRQRRQVAFDDMLFNLHQRLSDAESGDALATALRTRFPAALIDEFQDTDPLQFDIFRRIYTTPPDAATAPPAARSRDEPAQRPVGSSGGPGPLFFVGDPKQAIYSFRNADLHTYLLAGALADARYTLAQNQRSTEPLIEALNALFSANPRAFMLPGLTYQPVSAGAKPRQVLHDTTQSRSPQFLNPQAGGPQSGHLQSRKPLSDAPQAHAARADAVQAGAASAALQLWLLPPGDDDQPPMKAAARDTVARATAAEIARLVAAGRRGDITLGGRPLRAGDIAVLVRRHAQGAEVRQALAALNVGSVELSQASIYLSPDAEELERVLSAVLEPTRERLLKAALATELLGLDAAALDALSADEAALAAWVQRFAAWREAWSQRGIGVLVRVLMSEVRVAARFLARPDGERRLTNLLHLAECLQQAAEEHSAPEPLLRWFQARRQDGRGDDSTQLRLESDQNLVQIVTIHKAKGLEYPIVFCPYLWDGRLGGASDVVEGAEYHDDTGHGVVDFRRGLPDEVSDVRERIRDEQAAEALRLIYVTLTRAVNRCVLVAGCYRTASGRGTSPAEGNRSVLNWLAAGAGHAPAGWLANGGDVAAIGTAWHALAADHPGAITVAPLSTAPGVPLPATDTPPDALAALPPPPRPAPPWRIGSYSGLAHGAAHDDAAVEHDQRVPEDPPATAEPAPAAPADDDVLHFPRGSAAGDALHALFEAVDFDDPARWPEAIEQVLRAHRATLPADRDPTPDPMRRARMLRRLLDDVLDTPLPLGTETPLRLSTLPPARVLKEMEFHLPAGPIDAGALNRLLHTLHYPMPRLAFDTLRGYLKGFIDLVLEHEGRYFVVDWKSNHLGQRPQDYAAAPLAAAMAAQGYHLQHLLYSVALDRMLAQRIAGYERARHYGGIAYLFVRGLRPGWLQADGTPTGLYFHRPTDEALDRLSTLLDGGAG
jgi:exodeoxyribonuclease V beta subunit